MGQMGPMGPMRPGGSASPMGPIRPIRPIALLATAVLPILALGGEPPQRLRIALVARQPGDPIAAGIARGALSLLSRLDGVWPANPAAAQRLVDARKAVEAGELLRCQFIALLDVKGKGEVTAEVFEVAAGSSQSLAASGQLHELPSLLALALAGAMRLRATDALSTPVAANDAAVEALWQGDAAAKPEDQIRHYEAGIKSDPHSALLHNQLGAALARAGQLSRALAEFDHALKLDPDYAAAHTNRGLVLQQEKRWDEAERAFREAIRLGAKSPTPHLGLARLLERVGNIIPAVDELERALDADPSHVGALMTLADSYFESGNFRAARQMADRVAAVEPSHTGALNLIGMLQLVPRDYEGAEATFLRALTAKPDDPESLANLALALYGQGETETAIGILERVIARHPTFAVAHLYLGRIYLSEKRPNEAAAALQRAAELRPAMGDAQRSLASARSAAATQKPGCGCLGLRNPFASAFSADQIAGPLLPFAALLAPHAVRLARRRRPGSCPFGCSHGPRQGSKSAPKRPRTLKSCGR